MEYIFQIKIVSNSYDSFHRPVVAQEIIDVNNKTEVLGYIEKKYPEYFDGNKVAQKLSKKSEQIVYVTIYELDDYWSNYWKQEIECCSCHKKVKLIDIKNHIGHTNLNKWTCSIECEELRKRAYEDCKSEADEYYCNSCNFYFIYKITNKTNGKVYIGYTSREPIFRWWEHFKHSNLPLGQALKEDGIENFTFEVLEKHYKKDKTVEQMHDIESSYMIQYDSIFNGYNCLPSKKQDFEYFGEIK